MIIARSQLKRKGCEAFARVKKLKEDLLLQKKKRQDLEKSLPKQKANQKIQEILRQVSMYSIRSKL